MELFVKILKELDLGTFIATPQSVKGGYMHKMYKFETTKGTYAVKLLNPAIMKRTDALDNFHRAEMLEKKLEQNKLPIVPALEISGKKMQCVDGQYLYIFKWVDGRTLRWNEINSEHCRIVGQLLARIHSIESVDNPHIEKVSIDWDSYIARAKIVCTDLAITLAKHKELLINACDMYNNALDALPKGGCITNGDLDSKNVLWYNGKPHIIDLESLDYGNAYLDMFRLALDWSGNVVCNINKELLKAFIASYKYESGEKEFKADWNKLYGIGFSWVEWLDYNVKRALLLESDDKEEQKLGLQQAVDTLKRIKYYHDIKGELLECLSDC